MFGTSNGALSTQLQQNSSKNFKSINNLLTLQDNHVEEFFQYHGEAFFTTFEKMLEDIMERVMSQMLSKLEMTLDTTQGTIAVEKNCLNEYNRITQENIDLDIQRILGAALNTEVIMQRQMAKQQYLEAQGFSSDGATQPQMQMQTQTQTQPQTQTPNIQGQPMTGQMNQNMAMGQQAMNNQSGYPIPPSGYDQMNNPYWMDPATGQASYTAPNSGLGLGKLVQKGAAWAKWLA
tara:strand:+ start:602 stop:1303 length:702 start_codon:yes stop_codon:yes gene_type:complete